MHSTARPTRSDERLSTWNSSAAARTSKGRSLLPPPIAAWRIASYRRARASSGTVSRFSKARSMSAATVSIALRSVIGTTPIVESAGIERLAAARISVGPERDLFDPRLCRLELRLALRAELVALRIELNRFGEGRVAAFETMDDRF